ncbi:MAG: CDP-archaeol synthase [Betaproteobacteria bacterium]|nr:CDP-archaeol synthase [Betaproteobacteria bacterium]
MLKQRVVTALILAVLVLSVLFLLPAWGWGLLALVLLLLAGHEWARLGAWSAGLAGAFVLLLGGLALMLLFGPMAPGSAGFAEVTRYLALAASLFWIFVAPLWLRQGWRTPAPIPFFLLGVVLLLATWCALVILQRRSPWLVVAAIALVAAADIAAYFTGRALGRRKLAPAISPGKTWEGVGGAVVGVLVYAAALLPFAADLRPGVPLDFAGIFAWLIFALLLTVLAITGDLFESWLKRVRGVKDSGRILPGHGGVLDRIDALLPTMPATALFMLYALS